MAKRSLEKFKTYKNVFDNHTLRALYKLATEGHFDELVSPVTLGKEANIFVADKGDSEVIVKIYRLEVADFTRMYRYIRGDPRFMGLAGSRRKVIFAWCQREFRNLLLMRELGVPAPTPIAFKDNVLVMEMIGEPAPLKYEKPRDAKGFFDILTDAMRRMHKGQIVHGDLSEFNIINDKDKPVLIDFSHGTPKASPIYAELLERDIANVSRFASKCGVDLSVQSLRAKIGLP